jgi:hypothetical protein
MSATALDYPVLELRRTAIVAGGSTHVARYLETWCLDEHDETESIAFGQFFERDRADHVTWLRGYRDLGVRDAHGRERVRQAREEVLQRYILGSHSLLLRPLHPAAQIPALAPVDPAVEPDGAQGLAVAQLLPCPPGRLEECAHAADPWFARYNGRGMIEAGILASLDEAGDEPAWLVWLGLLRDDAALAALRPQCQACADALAAAGLLAGAPELLVLAPAPRSRLRWAPRTIA